MLTRYLIAHSLRISHTFSTYVSLRTFSSTRIARVGDTPTKFTNILAGANVPAVQIKTVTPEGIHLADGLVIPGACLFIEGNVFLWNVPPSPWQNWKPEHFEVFDAIVPKPGEYLDYYC
jgi:NADH dehydrogenase [ubiquinone] 1 alpha subcomplex assembly factor 3